MTDMQFSEWLNQHVAAFTSVGKEFASMQAEQRKLTADAWRQTLRQVALEDALAATAELFDSDGRPPFFDRVPATVRAIARRREEERRRTDSARQFARSGEAVEPCAKCGDGGQASVFVSGADLVAAMNVCGNDLDKAMRRTCAVLCDCDAGRRMFGNRKGSIRQRVISREDVLA